MEAFRLPLSWTEGDALVEDEVERRRAVGRALVPPMTTDSGIMRRVEGSMRFADGLGLLRWACSRFGRARAQDRRVEREARRAASWSAAWDGDIML